MDPSSSNASASNDRQKRVLPSRLRRGGPGVGSCEIDLLILEHQKKRRCTLLTLFFLSSLTLDSSRNGDYASLDYAFPAYH